MTLIKSISGIRGTIGGKVGQGLTPIDVVNFTAAYAHILKQTDPTKKSIIIGRDARISGDYVSKLVCGTLQSMGLDVIDLGLSTTPTVEMAVVFEQALGGIILTASHNPIEWNALKLLNYKGEFISDAEGKAIEALVESGEIIFNEVLKLGKYTENKEALNKHIEAILALDMVDVQSIKNKNFKIIVDAVNSSGGFAMKALLKALGVDNIEILNEEPTGHFAHNPEPLPENLKEIMTKMAKGNYDLGIVVDPDVDRLAFVSNDGSYFGEEYTLVAVADYVLKHRKGNTVSNLSSTRALRDVTEKAGNEYFASAVGEVNVVAMMKEKNAVIGGEGNGGIILPELHYGRDALVGVALFLSHLAQTGKSASFLRKTYPNYFIAKHKIELSDKINVDAILEYIKTKYAKQPINTVDGVKIEFDKEWVHLRKSNTEAIIRIYSESESETTADHLANKIKGDIKEFLNRQ